MVFLSLVNYIRVRGPDRIWNRRKIFFLSAAFRGRKRNCYSIALRSVRRALQYNRLSRPLKKLDMADLWEARISAGCEEHGISPNAFQEGLIKGDILLNRKVLSDIVAWEPRTFKSLTEIAKQIIHQENSTKSSIKN